MSFAKHYCNPNKTHDKRHSNTLPGVRMYPYYRSTVNRMLSLIFCHTLGQILADKQLNSVGNTGRDHTAANMNNYKLICV